ncbi:isochorismatase family protein [Thioalkalivibrio sp. ALJ1]|uniref:isochorismatase family protein n=1 Tax=Thioalkalivibrio sp. ALJ1 TaxID=1158144 RepID=UPI00056EBD4A|nr:isochorismatase family protein [Thioalkalivibrio sp. ALJ1]
MERPASNLGDRCDRARSRLVLIDLQERLLAAMPDAARAEVERNTARLIEAARQLDIPIEISRQYPKGLGDLTTRLQQALQGHGTVTDKTAFSCCAETELNNRLTTGDQIILTGAEAHICVTQTTLELLEAGVTVFVVEDGVCSRDAGRKRNGLERLRAAGAIITNHESVLFEWLRDAADPQFRELSQLIR